MKRWLLPLLFVALPAAAQPTNTVTYNFTNPPLWDLSGPYQRSGEVSFFTGSSTTVLTQSVTGAVSGTFADNDTNTLVGQGVSESGTVTGNVAGTNGTAQITVQWSWLDDGEYEGKAYTVSDHMSVSGSVSAASPELALTFKAHVCFQSAAFREFNGCTNVHGSWNASLATNMTGHWSLQLTNLTDADNILSGSAVLTLSNGRALEYSVTGRYHPSSATQSATLTLTGTGDATGTHLNLTTTGPQLELKTLAGHVLGQKLRFTSSE